MTDRSAEPDSPTSDRRELHQRIGLAAFRRGYIAPEQLAEAALTAGASPTTTAAELWVDSGFLDATELAEILQLITGEYKSGRRGSHQSMPVASSTTSTELGGNEDLDDPTKSYTLADVAKTIAFGPVDASLEVERETEPRSVNARSGLPADENERYILGGELGRGGVGRVIKCFDRDLGRTVAMKLPLYWPQTEENVEKFVEEAQATGQLEHPNIVPVYDIGRLSTGEAYYTMKRVPSYSLRDVLERLRDGETAIANEYTPTRLLNIFLQVCQAVHYAHVRGVVHRDLKPENIMLGSHGEVHVMDWGLARILDKAVVTHRSLKGGGEVESGHTVGTPAYMPPEQAQGYLDQVDERSDVYSLGVILYEIATLTQPSTRSTVMETLMAVISEPIRPPRAVAPDRNIPEDLEFIIMRAVDKSRAKRWATAKELHDAIEGFLDGRNQREAQRSKDEGDRYAEQYRTARIELRRLAESVREMDAKIPDWETVDVKRRLWALQDKQRATANWMIRTFGEASREYTQSLAHVPGFEPSRQALADILWERYKTAERESNELDQLYYESVLRQYDDGKYVDRIYGRASLSIETNPPGASVFIYAYDEKDRVLHLAEPEYLGETPVDSAKIERGSYQVRIKHPRRPAVHVPINALRPDPITLDVHLPDRTQVRPDSCLITGGISVIGGDPEAFDPLPLQRVHVESFFIGRYPVTFREYLEFLNELVVQDPELAAERAPRTREADGVLVVRRPDGLYVPNDVLIEGPMRKIYPIDEGHELNLPIVAVSYEDTLAYAAWRSEREGIKYRLPTEFEWERAARGADGRAFPWGNSFDATFCKMRGSRPFHSQPEPVGTFPNDCSPFDVFDMAGLVREMVQSDTDVHSEQVMVRAAGWGDDERFCRSASRHRMLKTQRSALTGFRLASNAPSTGIDSSKPSAIRRLSDSSLK